MILSNSIAGAMWKSNTKYWNETEHTPNWLVSRNHTHVKWMCECISLDGSLPHYNTDNLYSLWRWCTSSGRRFVCKLLDPYWGRAIVLPRWLSHKLESLVPWGVCRLLLTVAVCKVQCKRHHLKTMSSEWRWVFLTFCFGSQSSYLLLRPRSIRTIACYPFAIERRFDRSASLVPTSYRLPPYR